MESTLLVTGFRCRLLSFIKDEVVIKEALKLKQFDGSPDHRSVITSVYRKHLEDFQVQLRYRPRSLCSGILLFVSYLCQEL